MKKHYKWSYGKTELQYTTWWALTAWMPPLFYPFISQCALERMVASGFCCELLSSYILSLLQCSVKKFWSSILQHLGSHVNKHWLIYFLLPLFPFTLTLEQPFVNLWISESSKSGLSVLGYSSPATWQLGRGGPAPMEIHRAYNKHNHSELILPPKCNVVAC